MYKNIYHVAILVIALSAVAIFPAYASDLYWGVSVIWVATPSSISPEEGPVGTVVTLKGNQFGEIESVYFVWEDEDVKETWRGINIRTWHAEVKDFISKNDSEVKFKVPNIRCPGNEVCNKVGKYAVRIKTNDGYGGGAVEFKLTASPEKSVESTPKKVVISPADLKAKDYIKPVNVASTVERLFKKVWNKKITTAESNYWKTRARTDKPTESKLLSAMNFQKAKGKTMPPAAVKVKK